MMRFVLWFITKYLSSSDVVEALLDRWPRRDQTQFHLRSLYVQYQKSPTEERDGILRALNDYNYHDTPLKPMHYELMIRRALLGAVPCNIPNTMVEILIREAFIGKSADLNYVKYNAYLTNVVRKTLGDIPTTDVQLIVALLKKRVEE